MTPKKVKLTFPQPPARPGDEPDFSGIAVPEAGLLDVPPLDMDARFTLCNMAVEFSAFTGLIAPDATTIDYVRGRAMAPDGPAFAECEREWLSLGTDADADAALTLLRTGGVDLSRVATTEDAATGVARDDDDGDLLRLTRIRQGAADQDSSGASSPAANRP